MRPLPAVRRRSTEVPSRPDGGIAPMGEVDGRVIKWVSAPDERAGCKTSVERSNEMNRRSFFLASPDFQVAKQYLGSWCACLAYSDGDPPQAACWRPVPPALCARPDHRHEQGGSLVLVSASCGWRKRATRRSSRPARSVPVALSRTDEARRSTANASATSSSGAGGNDEHLLERASTAGVALR